MQKAHDSSAGVPVKTTVDSQDRVVSYTYVSKARREPVKPQVSVSLSLS